MPCGCDLNQSQALLFIPIFKPLLQIDKQWPLPTAANNAANEHSSRRNKQRDMKKLGEGRERREGIVSGVFSVASWHHYSSSF